MEKKPYTLGGNMELRLFMHEVMARDCFIAKRAYAKFCKLLTNPEYAQISKEDALNLYRKLCVETAKDFVPVSGGMAQSLTEPIA